MFQNRHENKFLPETLYISDEKNMDSSGVGSMDAVNAEHP